MSPPSDKSQENLALRAVNARLDKIVAIQARLADAELDLDRFLNNILVAMSEETFANGAILALREKDDLVIKAAAGSAEAGIGLPLESSNSLCGLCISTGETLISDDCATDTRVDYSALMR